MKTQAEELQRLLDGAPAEGTEEARSLAALAEALESRADIRPRDDFRMELRGLLVEEARKQGQQPVPLLTRMRAWVTGATDRWRYSTRMATATGAAALVLSGGGVAAAAEQAMPGDILYPVKLVLEDVRVRVVRDDMAKGERHLGYAADRVREARLSVDEGDQDGAATALAAADDSTRAGAGLLLEAHQERGDELPLQRLAEFTVAQRRRITALLPHLNGPASDTARDALVVLNRIDARLVAVGHCPSTCVSSALPSGAAFDFSSIPAADLPFQACPCESADPPPLRPRPTEPAVTGDTDTGGDPVATSPPPAEPEPDEPGVLPTFPEPLEEPGRVVDDVVKDVIEKVPAPAVPESGSEDVDASTGTPLDDAAAPIEDTVDGLIDDAESTVEDTTNTTDEVLDTLLP